MNVPLVVLWIVAGFTWVLSVFPWWWIPDPGPDPLRRPDVIVKPQPDPWRIGLIGGVGGLLGGWAYDAVWFDAERLGGVEAAATVAGAVIGAGLLVSIYRLATRPRARAAS
jgi:hypothetical protein